MPDLEYDASLDAPLPARSRFRWWLLKIGLLILVFVAWKGAYSLYRITRPNLPVVDYKQAERTLIVSWLSEDDRASGHNAFDFIHRAGEIYETIERSCEQPEGAEDSESDSWDHPYLGFGEAIGCDEQPSDDSLPSYVLLQAMHKIEAAGVLDLLDQASAHRRAVIDRDAQELMFGFESGIDLRRQSRALARFSAYRAARQLDAGNLDEAGRSLRHVLMLAGAFHAQADVIAHLSAYAIDGIALEVALRRVDCPDEQTLVSLLGFVSAVDDPPPLSRTVEGERLALLEVYQSVFTGVPPRNNDLSHFPSANTLKLVLLHADAAQAVNDYFDAVAAWVDAPQDQRAALREQVERIADRAPKGVTVGMLSDGYARFIATRDRVISRRRAATLILAIALYRERHGRLPASLEDLTPSILPSLPQDPFAPDGRFGFRVDGDPADPDCAFTVYSVGADGADDGGRPKHFDPHQAFEADSDEGTDIVFYPVAD